MSSVSNLFGLVNQLQSMEQSLTDLLMEIVAKLGNLTETNVFLLLETQEGRKISGHSPLCQQYLRGALTPVGADFLFDVDASVSAVRPLGCFDRGVAGNIADMNGKPASQRQSRKRPGGGLGGGADFNSKRRVTTSLISAQGKNTDTDDVVVVKMEKHDVEQQLNGVDNNSAAEDNDGDDVVAISGVVDNHTDFAMDPLSSFSSLNDDFANDSMNDATGNSTMMVYNQSMTTDASSSTTNDRPTTQRHLHPLPIVQHHRRGDVGTAGMGTGSDDDAEFLEVVNSKLAAQKMHALKCISGENACSRGTVENRLSTSLCYDFGKTLADVKPHQLTDNTSIKMFFNVHFDKWIHQFVNLSQFFQKSVSNGRPEGGQTFTFLGLLRQCARTAFFQRVARNKKELEPCHAMPTTMLEHGC